MDTYVVIQIKDKDEKILVCNLLVANTEAEFKVTTDLKAFVAKQFHVKITDYVEMKDQATDTVIDIITIKDEIDDSVAPIVDTPTIDNNTDTLHGQHIDITDTQPAAQADLQSGNQKELIDVITIKDEVDDSIVDVVPIIDIPTTDNNMDTLQGQHIDINDVVSSEEVTAQTLHPVHNQRDLLNIGTYVPYRERMIEPKEEVIIDEVVVEANKVECVGLILGRAGNQEKVIDVITVKENNPSDMDTLYIQHTDDDNIQPSEHVDTQSIPAVVDRGKQQELFNIVTNMLYRDMLIEPKQEVIIDDVTDNTEEREGGDGVINHDIDNDNTLTTIDKDIQSTSTKTTRSGRVPKRPRYSINEDETEYIPKIKQSNEETSNMEKSTGSDMTIHSCHKCGSRPSSYLQKLDHVMMHLNITKYECTAEKCGYKTAYRCSIKTHVKKHAHRTEKYREAQLTDEQTEQFEIMMKECFPGQEEDNENKCQICHQHVGGNSRSTYFKRVHALHHIDLMLYKCMEDGCQFESKSKPIIMRHRHGSRAIRKYTKVELSKEQEVKIDEVMEKCFPGLDKDNNEDDESNE